MTTAGRHQRPLLVLTAAKTAANAAMRWVGPFMPTLERALGTRTTTITTIMGVAELAGLSTSVSGRYLDRGHERRMIEVGLWVVTASSLIALVGVLPTFAISYTLVVVGVGTLTVAAHAWIGHRFAFESRNRAIGTIETSWAVSLLLGSIVLAAAISIFGWRGAYATLAFGTAVGALAVRWWVPADRPHERAGGAPSGRLDRRSFVPMIAAATTAAAGISMIVVSGAWLNDVYGFSTTELGIVAGAIGGIELVASLAVAAVADRVGARRSVALGLVVLLGGCATVFAAGSAASAIVGLMVTMVGFEFAYVASLTLVTEAAPLARGKAIGVSNAFGTIARATAVMVSGVLYETFAIRATAVFSAATGAVALVIVVVAARAAPLSGRADRRARP